MREGLTAVFRSLARAAGDIVFPPRCHSCSSLMDDDRTIHLCDRCRTAVTFIDSPLCTICGIPFLTSGGTDHNCSECLSDPPPYLTARAPVVHDGPVRHLIHLFKYRHKIQLRRPLGLLMAEHLPRTADGPPPDLVVPVPLHPKKLRQRGYNQALLLGELLARHWGIPLGRDDLQRTRWTEPQTELSAAERARNVRGAFSVARQQAVAGKMVLLVDDVYTTGSTVRECSRVLLREGAAGVLVATAARAIPS